LDPASASEQKLEVIEMIRDTMGVQQKLDGFLVELVVNFERYGQPASCI
jgi:hypothetical protein